jgi:hypothetical protein
MGIRNWLLERPRHRDVDIVPNPAPTPIRSGAHDAFVLGVNIEEIYCIFGESFQTLFGGSVSEEYYAVCERKIGWCREVLIEFDVSNEIVANLLHLETQVRRQTPRRVLSPDAVKALRDADVQTGNEMSIWMSQIRKQLDARAGLQYDLGIFTARLSLCVRVLKTAAAAQQSMHESARGQFWKNYDDIYTDELLRVGRIFARLTHQAAQADQLGQAFAPGLAAQLLALADMLGQGDTLSIECVESIGQHVERLLAQLGFT